MEKPRIPYNPSARYIVRTDASLSALVPEFRRIVAAIDPRLPLTDITTMDDLVAAAMSRTRIATTLLAAAATAALLLGAMGFFCVFVFVVVGCLLVFVVCF